MTSFSIFIAGITINGPEIIAMYPESDLGIDELDLVMKSLPMRAQCGDSLTVSVKDYQAVCTVFLVPPFEESYDDREKPVSLGFLIPKNENPMPYKAINEKIAGVCRQKDVLSLEVLKNVAETLYTAINMSRSSFMVETTTGIKLEFLIDKELDAVPQLRSVGPEMEESTGTEYAPVLSMDEIMEREKNAFLIDKFVLRQICTKGPISLEEIWRQALSLESVLGSRINLAMIEEICEKYVKDGIIKRL